MSTSVTLGLVCLLMLCLQSTAFPVDLESQEQALKSRLKSKSVKLLDHFTRVGPESAVTSSLSLSERGSGRIESDCFAPHLKERTGYAISVHTHQWKAARTLFGDNKTFTIDVLVSTESVRQSNVYSWLHKIEVRGQGVKDATWLSRGLLIAYMQQTCSQLNSMPLIGYDVDVHSQSFLGSIVAMIPLSLSTNTSVLAVTKLATLRICTDWLGSSARSDQPHSVTIQVDEDCNDCQSLDTRLITKTWLEMDECGETMRYSVSNQLAGSRQSIKLSIQRVLIRSSCSFTESPVLCHKNSPDYQPSSPLLQSIPAFDALHGSTILNDNLRTIAANLTAGPWKSHLEFQND